MFHTLHNIENFIIKWSGSLLVCISLISFSNYSCYAKRGGGGRGGVGGAGRGGSSRGSGSSFSRVSYRRLGGSPQINYSWHPKSLLIWLAL